MNLPNIITIGRILLVPFTVWLIISGDFALAFAAFVVAGVSDGVDGYIARKFNQRSELGAYLDPIADKALLVCIYISLGFLQIPRLAGHPRGHPRCSDRGRGRPRLGGEQAHARGALDDEQGQHRWTDRLAGVVLGLLGCGPAWIRWSIRALPCGRFDLWVRRIIMRDWLRHMAKGNQE